jgi:hypothetical protein
MSTETPATATPISQADAACLFLPAIKARGRRYAKFGEVVARPAVPGEVIVTMTADGKETENTAKDGDVVVRNCTRAAEEYILSAAKLAGRYEAIDGDAPDGFKRFKAKGEIDAIVFRAADFGVASPFYFMAPWGEPMPAKDGDTIGTIDDTEVYRIAAKEFGETYRAKGD